ncbi:right-handed parallel beta-helix repeat-containing protein [Bacillus sp. UNC322MFChir4.1]|uniref:right-handed parallel beta-helix repeat-containing protein n=1 Tax=Bacillus sp. UNC322MFChir4.1 TaxID=1449045 RepID=UPI0005563E39|nr:right-handed parallel beta-helix repeat-containing protein [Bacillus sp. UNC322MFChir4.1]
MNYLIELDKWGIKQGIPTKPYTDENFIQADLNIQGLNNAIQYAHDNEYSSLTLPRGEYTVCYPRQIQMLSNLTLDLNSSKLKVIYDSDRKSPFDNRTGIDYHNFVGITLSFAKAERATVKNGEIEGCRSDRSFLNDREVAVEHSYGVAFREGSRFCELDGVDIHDYMGDNVSFLSSALIGYAEFDEGCTINSLDYSTGQPIPVTSPKTVVTKMLNIQFDKDKKVKSMYVGGLGYARLTGLYNKFFDVFFYDKNDEFIGAARKRRIYSDITIPNGATKYRMQFLDESVIRQHAITVWFGYIPSHNVIKNCDIHDGHRGGITLGGSHNIVENNVIRGNGKGLARFLDKKPIFNDPTRYAINMEDSYGSKCVIRNNDIYDSYHGILVGCFDVEVISNHIHDIDYWAVNLYSISMAKIRDNYFYNNLNNIGLMTSTFYSPYVLVEGNTFVNGSLNLNTTAYKVELKHNQFINPMSIVVSEGCTMSDSHITYTETLNGAVVVANKLKNCSFKSSQAVIMRELTMKVLELENCSFENLRLRFETQNVKVPTKIKVINPTFVYCEIRNHTFGAPNSIDIIDGKLTDTFLEVGITNVDNINPYTKLYNCQININSSGIKHLFVSDCNRSTSVATYIAEKCKINITNSSFAYVLNSGSANQSNELLLRDNEISYSGTGSLNLVFYKNATHIKNFVLDDKNTFTNMNLPAIN